MRTTVFAVLTVFLLAGSIRVLAQEQQQRQRVNGRPDGSMLQQKLNLTEEQRIQIDKIFEEAKKSGQADRVSMKDNPEELRELAKQRREDTQNKILSVLNPEQQKKFKEMTDKSNRTRRDQIRENSGDEHASQKSQSPIPPGK